MFNDNKYLRIAVQKSGRLRKESLDYLYNEYEIPYRGQDNDLFYSDAKENVEFLFLREKDIPAMIQQGYADIGIVGKNTFLESCSPQTYTEELGFSKCRMSIAIPKNILFTDVYDLAGATIATSYPNALMKYLDQYNIYPNICEMSGSVEIAPALGCADVIFDLVETGNTLRQNNLREVLTVFQSEAIAIISDDLKPCLEGKEMTLSNILDLPYQSRLDQDMYGKAYTNFPWNCHRSFG